MVKPKVNGTSNEAYKDSSESVVIDLNVKIDLLILEIERIKKILKECASSGIQELHKL